MKTDKTGSAGNKNFVEFDIHIFFLLNGDGFVKSYNMPFYDTVTENNFCKSRIKVYLLSEASDNKGR